MFESKQKPDKSRKTSKEIKAMTDTPRGWPVASLAYSAAIAAALCLSIAAQAPAADQSPANQAATPAPVKGEFDNSCAMGLASGQTVKTDCSVNWTDADGHIYCFSSEDSKAAFLKDPAGNLQKAREFLSTKQASAAKGTKEFTEEDVNKRVQEVITERSKDGAFVFHDPKLDADLNLQFEQIKIVRGMQGYGWFANVIFHDKDEAKKQYAIDFWFKPEGDQLTLMDIRVQKGPKQDGDSYYMITRMPVAWWWLPVQEHPGDMEVTRAWQVMSAIHSYIATHKDANGALEIKDDKTGETIPLDFVEIHQPVRHLKKEGEYFVCTDFRKPGSKDEYYDIDFWVNQKGGKLAVDNVKIHKVPVQEDGIWTQQPRYTFEGMDFDVTN
jgi:YHS domain-containing protein